MREPTALAEQIAGSRGDRLRVLIAGAGVAGLTLASLLRAEGLHPVVVERTASDAGAGYMLALMPLVDPVFREMGVTEAYRAASEPFHRYCVHGRHGRTIREYSMSALLDRFGDYRGIERGTLLEVLAHGVIPVSFETTITDLGQAPGEGPVAVTLKSSQVEAVAAEFDVVIAADGLHSMTRDLVLRPDQITEFDTGWGGWIAWTAIDPATADLGEEVWGADFFVGRYPVLGRAGVIVCGNRADTNVGPAAFTGKVRDSLTTIDAGIDGALRAVANADDPYFWQLVDCRCETWAVGRVGLVGDAAAGFLPTAGIGAAMAIESAGMLARHLAEASPAAVPAALRAFEQRQRPRVEAAQTNSRQLAQLMFRRSAVVAALRDIAIRFVPLKVALGPIRKLLDGAPTTPNR